MYLPKVEEINIEELKNYLIYYNNITTAKKWAQPKIYKGVDG